MIVLAVDEICANRIIHSNQSNKNNFLEVEIADKGEGVFFNIKDTGDFYDNTTQEDPDLLNLIKEKRKGGIGLMLVRKIMDSIEVKKEDPYTTYTLFKKLKSTHA
jgi:serine/threonine-protein kinase RsbW